MENPAETPAEQPTGSPSHLQLPVPIPSFTHLTNQQLQALRSRFHSESKEARKLALKSMSKDKGLQKLWMRTLAGGTAEALALAQEEFESEAVKSPDAFLSYAWANALQTLDKAVYTEMLERSKRAPVVGSKVSKVKRL